MAGLQSCCRGIVNSGNLSLLSRNGLFLNRSRGKHFLAFRIPQCEKPRFIDKSKVFNSYFKYSVRFSSSNVSPQNTVVSENVPPVTNNTSSVANNAVNETTTSQIVIDEASLPAAPTVEDPELVLEFVTTGLKEPTFESLGLGSYWPSGIIQQILEFVHINLDLPWWAAISTITIIIRMLVFPLTLKAKRNAVRLHNNLPEFQRLQLKVSEARQMGNYYDVALYSEELSRFLKDKNILAAGSFLPPLVQAPIFLSVYLGLKGMAGLPVESLKTGGLFWFQDLTVCDPYYILPVFTCATLYLVIEIGAESGQISVGKAPWLKNGLRAIPLVILPFIYKLPGAVLWYWTVSNSFTLLQTVMLKIPAVAKACDIPVMVQHSKNLLPKSKKGVVEGFKEGMANLRITRELEDRERVNSMTFEEAGKSPIQRTFKKNPQLQKSAAVK